MLTLWAWTASHRWMVAVPEGLPQEVHRPLVAHCRQLLVPCETAVVGRVTQQRLKAALILLLALPRLLHPR
jgi:hypothetical protein